jgi:hypothetical protein
MDCCSSFMAPAWVLNSLTAFFSAGFLFYMYRLLRPQTVKSVYKYTDWQNEIGHGLCMLSMAAMLAPSLLPISSAAWTWILGIGAAFFTCRALTWGRTLWYNKWWYDWAHVGMLGGMAIMFHPLDLGPLLAPLFLFAQQAFWSFFFFYYAYELSHDIKAGEALYIGSDLSHLTMGLAMFVMVTWPMALMPNHHMSSSTTPAMMCQLKATPTATHLENNLETNQ